MSAKAASTWRDGGLAIIRIGLGIMFIWHGHSKMFGGTETWRSLGMAMEILGVSFAPVFWGFMAAVSEFFGGLFLLLGLGTRLWAALLAFTMSIAAAMHLSQGHGLRTAAHAMELAFVFTGLILTGAGRFSLEGILFRTIKAP